MSLPHLRVRDACKKKLDEAFQSYDANSFPTDVTKSSFVQELEHHLYYKVCGVANDDAVPDRGKLVEYREKVFSLITNVPKMGKIACRIPPEKLASLDEKKLVDEDELRLLTRDRHKRARENALRIGDDDTNVMCDVCNLPIASRLSQNRDELNDQLMGFQDFCECRPVGEIATGAVAAAALAEVEKLETLVSDEEDEEEDEEAK